MTRILLNGSKGRMGLAIIECALHDDGVEIVSAIDQGDDASKHIAGVDAVIDFSHHTVTPGIAKLCADNDKSLVIGTTGHTEPEREAVTACSSSIPIVFAPNFSVGVNTLFWLTRKAAEILGPDFDLEVIEMHHRLKKDAPSGTARRLGEILAEVRDLDYLTDTRHGREGITGARTTTEIGMHSLRGGDVVGDHTVVLANMGERIELTHKASSRDTFAKGALRAATWTRSAKSGLYDMQDVLGLR